MFPGIDQAFCKHKKVASAYLKIVALAFESRPIVRCICADGHGCFQSLPILYHEAYPLSLYGILCAWADSSKGCQNLLVLGPTSCTKQLGRYGQLRIDCDIVPVHHTHPCGCRTSGRPGSAMHSSLLLLFVFLRASLPIRSSFTIRLSLHQGDRSNVRM